MHAQADTLHVLRDATQLYKVDIEAITAKVKQEFAAKEKAKAAQKATTKLQTKAAKKSTAASPLQNCLRELVQRQAPFFWHPSFRPSCDASEGHGGDILRDPSEPSHRNDHGSPTTLKNAAPY